GTRFERALAAHRTRNPLHGKKSILCDPTTRNFLSFGFAATIGSSSSKVVLAIGTSVNLPAPAFPGGPSPDPIVLPPDVLRPKIAAVVSADLPPDASALACNSARTSGGICATYSGGMTSSGPPSSALIGLAPGKIAKAARHATQTVARWLKVISCFMEPLQAESPSAHSGVFSCASTWVISKGTAPSGGISPAPGRSSRQPRPQRETASRIVQLPRVLESGNIVGQ